jgi:hypothetical protein
LSWGYLFEQELFDEQKHSLAGRNHSFIHTTRQQWGENVMSIWNDYEKRALLRLLQNFASSASMAKKK